MRNLNSTEAIRRLRLTLNRSTFFDCDLDAFTMYGHRSFLDFENNEVPAIPQFVRVWLLTGRNDNALNMLARCRTSGTEAIKTYECMKSVQLLSLHIINTGVPLASAVRASSNFKKRSAPRRDRVSGWSSRLALCISVIDTLSD